MSALSEIFVKFTSEMDTDALEQGEEQIGKVIDKVKDLVTVLGAGALVNGIRNLVVETAQLATQLQTTATQFGLTTQALQNWQHAAAASGIETELFNDGLKTLQERLGLALSGSEEEKRFNALGISIRDAHGAMLPMEQVLENVSTAMRAMPDDARAAAIGIELMGESGGRLAVEMRNGRMDIDAAAASLQNLGGGISEEAVAASTALTTATRLQQVAWTSLSSELTEAFAPALTAIAQVITVGIAKLAELEDKTGLVSTTLTALSIVLGVLAAKAVIGFGSMAVAAASAWVATLGPIALVVAGVAGVIAIVRDLWSWFQGGESVIGSLSETIGTFLDGIFEREDFLGRWAQAILLPFRAVQTVFKTLLWMHGRVMNLMGVEGYEGSTGTLEDALEMDAAEINMTPEQRARRAATQTAREMGGTTEEIAAENAAARSGRAMSGEEPRTASAPSPSTIDATVAAVERSSTRRAMARGLEARSSNSASAPRISASTAQRLSGATNNNTINISISGQGLDENQVSRLTAREVERALAESTRDALEDQEGLAI